MLDRVCIICGERHSIYLLTHGGASLYQCLDCELIFRHPAISSELESGISSQMSKSDQNLVADESTANLEAIKRCRQALLNDGLAGSKIAVLSLLKENPVSDMFKASGFSVETSTDKECTWLGNCANESYEVIIVEQFLERCSKPDEVLKHAHRVLKKDGRILVVFSSLESKLRFGGESFSSPSHLFYFNHSTMQLLLEKSGFRKIWNVTPDVFLGRKSEISDKQSLSVIMPVYNEKQTFEIALNRVLQKNISAVGKYEVVIVDNRSTDGTTELVKKYIGKPGIKVVFANEVQGKGYAVRKGLMHATGDIVLIQDADLEYDIDDYNALLEPLLQYKKIFVLGSRHKGKWKMRSFINNQLSATILNTGQVFFTTLLNVFYNQQMTDPLTMYKVFRRECLYGLRLECDGFDFDQELVAKLIRKGYTPHEVRVNYRSRSFSEGKKISMLRDPIICLLCDLKYRFVSPFEAGWKESPPANPAVELDKS